MMRPEGSRSKDHPDHRPERCSLCSARLTYHELWCPSHPASSTAKAEGRLVEFSLDQGPVIHPVLRVGVGSSLTRRGAGASRSWSVTASSGSVCRRLRRKRSVPIWEAVRSQRGMGTGRTSDSSRSLPAVDDTTGTVEVTRADLVNMSHAEFEAIVRGEPKWGQ